MFTKLKTAYNILQKEGFRILLEKTVLKVMHRFGFETEIQRTRLKIGEFLKEFHGNKVGYGLFKGMVLREDEWWAKYDKSPMILGTYEAEVQKRISELSTRCNTFVDIGAADGYFGIGTVFSKKFQKSICFENSEKGRNSIRKNALKNDIEDKVIIYGRADQHFVKLLDGNDFSSLLILCDIEGGEYQLLSKDVLISLKACCLIVELHEFNPADQKKANEFLKLADELFDVEIFSSGLLKPSLYTELSSFSDNERFLAFSEGRPSSMRWALLKPTA